MTTAWIQRRLDLNCDMGETREGVSVSDDAGLLDHVTSASIACGFHAGDPGTMHRTVRLAIEKGVAVGAHPSLDDVENFGRIAMNITPDDAYDLVVYQTGALAAFAHACGGRLAHVKPHGALYNMAARDAPLSRAIAAAVKDVDPTLVLFGLAGSELVRAGEEAGLAIAHEVFADRTYQADGTLTPRSQPNSMIRDANASIAQVLEMVRDGNVRSLQGTDVPVRADTLCIHGDEPGAVEFARRIRATLLDAGVRVSPFSKP
jgi:5-oxoprolinase (ATP-hydrolysing) subunit A